MGIVSMQKMSIVAHESERNKILRVFLKSGVVEIGKTEVLDKTAYVDDTNKRQKLESKLLRVGSAITFLKERCKEMTAYDKKNAPKLNVKRINRLVDIDEYYGIARDEQELNDRLSEMEEINGVLVDQKSERSRLIAQKEQLLIYKDLEVPFADIKDTEYTNMTVGTVPTARVGELEDGLADKAVIVHYDSDKLSCVAVIYHKSQKVDVLGLLSGCDFIKCPFEYNELACDKIYNIDLRLEALDKEREEKIRQSMNYVDFLSTLKIAYDYFNIELSKIDCMAQCPHTEKAFIMEGWVPKDKAELLEKKLNDKCSKFEVYFRDPYDNENPPTLTVNPKAVSAFDGITDMFGAPNYREQDPNLFVALFYFLFFGIMISDAGYGLLMAIACFTFVKIVKPVKNSGKMMVMFGFCGISTVIWGALFGGWFGVELGSLPVFLQKITWFSPLDEPLKMFMLALGMGVLQIGTGFALKGIAEIKGGNVLGGILNNFSWVVVFIGLLFMSPNLMVFLGAIRPNPVPSAFGLCNKIGLYTALAGFILLLIGGAVGKKNPFKMVTGALGNAYGAINVVSDLLSYSRLFGLGLTTGVIGYVINMLANIIVNTFFGGLWVGWIIAVPVLIIGHLFNFGINLLGAYVHNSRLQYIEFFGKFYEGNGRAFLPLGSKTKYTFLDN